MPQPSLITYLILYLALHSLLASLPVKAWAQRMFGDSVMRWYRLTYNVLAVVLLAPLPLLLAFLPSTTLYIVPEPWRWVMLGGQGVALMLMLVTLRQTDMGYFLGLAQLRGTSGGTEGLADPSVGDDALIVNGLYAYVRHPLYTFSLLFIWLSPAMTANLLAVFVLFTIYFYIGSIHEEHRLVRVFGETYRAYQRRVPRLFPRLLPRPRHETVR
ncbi:MAG: isoprenylcysteine carboxylmethyltransferase family protein [Chloroflexaceae bacterium]|nr:isoprenylcysteine carboxylmethyltransferase family protein [Chloroflexaceae bacterium]